MARELDDLILKRLQLPGIRNLKATELRLAVVERHRADPALTAHIRSSNADLLMLQQRYDLFFVKP